MLDTWLESVSQQRANVPPEKLPWDAFRTLLGQSIYGGRIDNDFDQRLLQSFIGRLFTKESFDSEFPLVSFIGDGDEPVRIPEGMRREQFIQWSESLPDYQSPQWLGLPSNAEKVILTNLGESTTVKLLKMQTLSEDDELAYSNENDMPGSDITLDVRPMWMKQLQQSVKNWLHVLPENLNTMKRTLDNIKDPLFRFFEREVNLGYKLLSDMRANLNDVMQVCEGNKKQTNDLRILIDDLVKGSLPKSWNRYTTARGLTVIQWIVDLSERLKQLASISRVSNANGAKELKNVKVWLGGLFMPEAFITASRQYIAQVNQWSLEELALKVTIADKAATIAKVDDCSFIVTGLKLQGGECSGNKLSLVNTITTELPEMCLQWQKIDPINPPRLCEFDVTLPVYLNQTRIDLLFTVDGETTGQVASRAFYERGVAFIASHLSG
jgi:dynein heavy chain 1